MHMILMESSQESLLIDGIFIYSVILIMQRVRQVEKSRCRDTVKSEKTGTSGRSYWLLPVYCILQLNSFDLNPFIFSFFIAHVPIRERVKIKKNMGPTSTLEVYLNQQLRRHPSNGDSSRSSTGSPPQQPGLLQVADNQIRCLPVDLNENGKSNKYFCLRIVKFLVSPTNKKIQFYLRLDVTITNWSSYAEILDCWTLH